MKFASALVGLATLTEVAACSNLALAMPVAVLVQTSAERIGYICDARGRCWWRPYYGYYGTPAYSGTYYVRPRYFARRGYWQWRQQREKILRRSMATYDDQNIFAKILRGEVPCYKVYENRHTLAFLDIMPRSPGHTLVIPRAAARGILDIAADDLADVARSAKKIAVAAVKAFDAEGIIVQQFSEAASGQVIFHFHMHVMPMRTGVELLPPQTRKEDAKVLEDHAARMIVALRD